MLVYIGYIIFVNGSIYTQKQAFYGYSPYALALNVCAVCVYVCMCVVLVRACLCLIYL